MTVALAIAIISALAVIAFLVHALLSGLKSERASFAAEVIAGKAQVAAERAQWLAEKEKDKAEQQRDEEKAARVKAEAERDDAKTRLVDTQVALNKALEEDADAIVTQIRSAPNNDRAREHLAELLKAAARPEAVPAAGGSGAPAGDDHRAP